MKTTIYMVRHCESEGNACRRSQARFDGIVTRKGLEQSQVLADHFADTPITAIYSSDAYRSRVTAAPLAVYCFLSFITDGVSITKTGSLFFPR